MTQSGNVSVVVLEAECTTDKTTVVDFIDSNLNLGINITFSTFCSKDPMELEAVFSDPYSNIFLGAIDYKYNTLVYKYADLNQRPLITPHGSPTHVYHTQVKVLSLGASFESLAVALRLVLTQFKWGKLAILVEIEENIIAMATAMFVELTHAKFQPKIIYLANTSEDTTLERAMDFNPEYKGKAIYIILSITLHCHCNNITRTDT